MEALITYLHSAGLTEADAAQIAGHFTYRHMARGEFFAEEGKTSHYLGFVEKGFFQYYVIINGEEKTTYSVGAGGFLASLVSFMKQVPSQENIRAVLESDLWLIERTALRKLLEQMPAFARFYTSILEWQICCIDESRLDSLLLDAGERYKKMLDKEPVLLQQIPLQYLASILGVTPRHLSRIRNNIR